MAELSLQTSTPDFGKPRTAAAAADASAPGHLRMNVRRSLLVNPRIAIAAGAAAMLLVACYAALHPAVYQAEAVLFVAQDKPALLGNASSQLDPSQYEALMEKTMLAFQRHDLLEGAVENMPEGGWRRPGESVESAAARLGDKLKTSRAGMAPQILVTLDGPGRESTPRALQAVLDEFLVKERESQGGDADERLRLLAQEKQSVEAELARAREEQNRLNGLLGVAMSGPSRDPFDEQVQSVRDQLDKVRRDRALAAAQLSGGAVVVGDGSGGAAAGDDVSGDASLASTRRSIDERRRTLQSQMATMTSLNPVYQQDQRELGSLDKQLDSATTAARAEEHERAERRLQAQVRQSSQMEGILQAQLAQQAAKAVNAGPAVQRSAEVSEMITRLSTQLSGIEDAMRGTRLNSSAPPQARIELRPGPFAPRVPDRSRMLLLASLPLGLLAAIAAALLAAKLQGRLYAGDDVESALGFPPIAVVPAAEDVSPAVLEEFWLRLAAGIESACLQSGARSFVFTAVNPGPDMEVVVEKVRAKLEDLGYQPLWMSAAALLAASETEGASRTELMRTADRARAGVAATRLNALQRAYDLVLVDAPPLLQSAEAEYAVRRTDATILVCESGVTTLRDVTDAAALLHRLHVSGVGVVMKDLKLRLADAAYRERVGGFAERSPSRAEVRVPPGPVVATAPDAEVPVTAAEPVVAVPVPAPPVPPLYPEPAPVAIVIRPEPIRVHSAKRPFYAAPQQAATASIEQLSMQQFEFEGAATQAAAVPPAAEEIEACAPSKYLTGTAELHAGREWHHTRSVARHTRYASGLNRGH